MVELEGFAVAVAASAGAEDRARELAGRTERVLSWHSARLGWRPAARLTVADETDWSTVAPVPIYGVPQTWVDHTILAAGNAPLFDEIARALMAGSSPAVRRQLVDVYGDPPCLLGFFDQFLAHELVHLFCEQADLRPAPLWVLELLCNLGMVGYLREQEPEILPVLRTAVTASAHLPPGALAVTALAEMEASFEAGPVNFGWYQLRLTTLADHLWHAAGPQLYPALYRLLRQVPPATSEATPGAVSPDEVGTLSPAVRTALACWPSVP